MGPPWVAPTTQRSLCGTTQRSLSNAVPLHHMRALLETLVALDAVTKKHGFLENDFQ